VTDDVADGVNERAHEQVREVLPDYVLGALSLDLADEVGQHIAFCLSCQQLFETMVGSLVLLGPLEIPAAAVKERLFARIGDHRSNGVATLSPPAAPPPPASTAPLPEPERALPPRAPVALHPKRPPAWQLALVATLVALLCASGIWNFIQQRQLASQGEIARLLADPQAAHALTDTDLQTGAAGTIYAAPTGNVALVVVSRLPALNPDQRYQLWLFTESGTRESGGLFTVSEEGIGQVVVRAPQAFANYWAVAISAEPAAGSAEPTSALTLGGWIR